MPAELARAILTTTGANEGNVALNRVALVGRSWHNALAPQEGACIAALTRYVTLGEKHMLAVAQIAQPWWRVVYMHEKMSSTEMNGR